MHLIVVYSYLWNKSQILQSHIRYLGTEFLEHIPRCSCSLGDLCGFWNIQSGSQGSTYLCLLILFFHFVLGENHRSYRHHRIINFGNVRGWYENVCVDQSFWTVALDSVRKARVEILLRIHGSICNPSLQFSSVQFSCSVVSNSLRPHGLQHAGLPCPSLTPRAYWNSCPSSWWCHPTISSSVVPFSQAFISTLKK